MNLRHPLMILLLCMGFSFAKAPLPPSNLKIKALGVNSFLLTWKDNSKNEVGWEILAAVGVNTKPTRFLLVPTANITSYVVLTNELPGQIISFQMSAYNGKPGAEKTSPPTSVVNVRTFDAATFEDPTAFTAKALDDGRIRLSWNDRATSESGYQIQFRKGKGKWKEFGNTNPDTKFSLVATNFQPGTSYAFRVRGFKNNPPAITGFSNVAEATTLSLRAPVGLVATPEGEGSFKLKWKDRSSVESGFEIESRTGTAAYTKLGDVGFNVTSTNAISGFALDSDIGFRVRAFRLVGKKRQYSSYTKVSTARSSGLSKPIDLAGTPVDETSIQLTWKDVSKRELGYVLRYREKGTETFEEFALAADSKQVTLSDLESGKIYEVDLRAFDSFVYSASTPLIELSTRDRFSGDFDPPIFWNTSFLHTINVLRPSDISSATATGLPAGLVFTPSTLTFSGTTTEEGLRNVTVTANFRQGYSITRTLVLRIVRPEAAPVVSAAFAPVTVTAGNMSSVSTDGRFADPDSPAARRFTTTLGSFDVILYSSATPGTVANFLAYADAGLYQNTFFHRAAPGFVVQGGGFSHDGSSFGRVTTFPAIQNEPGISSLTGTVAMAKLGGDPNSATSQFFANLSDDNASNLDFQNGGFTVFGRIAGNGMNLFNQIDGLPRGDYTVNAGGTQTTLEDVPLDTPFPAPVAIDATKLVKVTGVTAAPILTYEASSSNPAIATAAMNGNNVIITGVAAGGTTVQVKAIDLDGGSVTQSIPVTVP